MTAREGLKTYKEQYGVEQNFSFLKEPLIANNTFLKKSTRHHYQSAKRKNNTND